MRKSSKSLALGLLALLMFAVFYIYHNQEQVLVVLSTKGILNDNSETERSNGYFTVKDEDGRLITATALPVYIGDEFIASDNKHYKVVKINGDTALAKFIGVDQLAYDPAWDQESVISAATGSVRGKIGVYHTHTDESYVPTDGKESIWANGGIMKVGNAYTKAMEQKGVSVIHSTRPHDPHDANAYNRSRRTALELLKKNPAAIVDVHRDAVPPEVYRKVVAGKEVTKIKMVVGRRNPKMSENLKFAQNIKSYMDKHKPGMIEGIFIAKGNYNQELSPRAMLIEVGAHTNSRYAAESGVALFSEAIPRVSGVFTSTGPGAGAANPGALASQNRSSWSTLGWILAAVIIGIGAFLLISTGSIKGSVNKIKGLTGEELANALFRRKQKDKK